jgi:hypothetical protein
VRDKGALILSLLQSAVDIRTRSVNPVSVVPNSPDVGLSKTYGLVEATPYHNPKKEPVRVLEIIHFTLETF